MIRRERAWVGEALICLVAAVITVAVEVYIWRLWEAHLGIPFSYSADGAFSGALIKGMVENGRLWLNPSIGAPGITNMLDYPIAELVHLGAMWPIAAIQGNWAFAMNAYYLLGYPLAAAAATWAMRRVGVSAPVSVGMGILYAFIPYHLYRGEMHFFLSQYYLVPLVAVLALELCGDRPPLVDTTQAQPRIGGWRRASMLFPLVICLLAGSSGVYYVFFGILFLAAGGILGWRQHGQRVRLYASGMLIAAMLLSTAVSLAPFIAHRSSVGTNPSIAVRNPAEAELFALTLTQMLLPQAEHRVPSFASLRTTYEINRQAVLGPWIWTEANYVGLGVVGGVGFLILVWLLIFGTGASKSSTGRFVEYAAKMNGAGLLFTTVGGFCALLAIGFSQIRAYNRIIVFLAFFAFLASAWLLDRAGAWVKPRWRTAFLCVLAVAITFIGLADQLPATKVDHEAQTAHWRATRIFVRDVEKSLPEGAMVLQLPYMLFPENGTTEGMADYDHFLPYLVSNRLHWSYGAVRGREDAIWLEPTSSLPAPELVKVLRDKGFSAIWVDRKGYKDQGLERVDGLKAIGAKAVESEDGRYVFMKLPPQPAP